MVNMTKVGPFKFFGGSVPVIRSVPIINAPNILSFQHMHMPVSKFVSEFSMTWNWYQSKVNKTWLLSVSWFLQACLVSLWWFCWHLVSEYVLVASNDRVPSRIINNKTPSGYKLIGGLSLVTFMIWPGNAEGHAHSNQDSNFKAAVTHALFH